MIETKICPKCKGYGEIVIEEIDNFNSKFDDCPDCNGTGKISVSEDQIVYVNVYKVTRKYGGPEEGGWWYNDFECLEVYPVRNKNSDIIKKEMEEEYASIKHGNIYSVLGGADLAVYIEFEPKQYETREKPHYE